MKKYFYFLIFFTPLLYAQENVTLQLKWSHQFQFAGYYAAKEKGFYEDAGFNVDIRPRDPKSNAITEVLNGNADFGISDTSIVVHRLNGQPVVIASTVFQTSPLIFLSLSNTAIRSPYDLRDKRIMFQKSVDDASLQAMLLLFGLNEEDYIFVDHDFDDWALINNKADVMSAYRSNQPIKYNNQNINVNILEPASYGIDFYGDLLFTTEERVKSDFESVQRFVSATKKGWKYALENKEEIARLIISKYGYPEPLSNVLQEADATEQLIKPKFVPIGTVFPSRFEMIANTYKSLGMANQENDIKGLLLKDYEEENFALNLNAMIAFFTIFVLFFCYAISQRYFNNKLKKIVALQTTQLEKSNSELSEKNELLRLQNQEVLNAKLTADQANESKSLFFANMTHELRTPLHGILNLADFAIDDESIEEKNRALKSILSSTHILSNIVNDVLDFSKIEAGKLEIDNIDFDLKELIYTITKPLKQVAQSKNISFTINYDNQLASTLIGDPVRISQIVNNLCSNAIKFTEQGGVTISIQLVNEQSNLSPKSIQNVLFEVRDTGVGISKTAQNNLFKAFHQADISTSRKYGGTGLGLSICASLSDLMGGSLSFSSTEGQGSTFSYHQTFEVSKLSIKEQNKVAKINLEGVRILVAEDTKVNQIIINKMLQAHKAEIVIMENGVEALNYLNKNTADLIFMDIQMPIMGGIEAIKEIRKVEHFQSTPIIAMTANTMKEDIEYYLSIGADDYLTKPFNGEKLNELLNTLKIKYLTTKISDTSSS